MKEQTKEIIFSLLNIVVLAIIFTGLSDPLEGAIVASVIIGIVLSTAYFSIGNIIVDIYELCTSVIDRMIEAIMRWEARIIGVTKGDFSE